MANRKPKKGMDIPTQWIAHIRFGDKKVLRWGTFEARGRQEAVNVIRENIPLYFPDSVILVGVQEGWIDCVEKGDVHVP